MGDLVQFPCEGTREELDCIREAVRAVDEEIDKLKYRRGLLHQRRQQVVDKFVQNARDRGQLPIW